MRKGVVVTTCIFLCAAAGALSYYTVNKKFDKRGKYFGMADDSKVNTLINNYKKQKNDTVNTEHEQRKNIEMKNLSEINKEKYPITEGIKYRIKEKVQSQLNELKVYDGEAGYVTALNYLEDLYGKGNVSMASKTVLCRDDNYNLYIGYFMNQQIGINTIKHFYLVDADGNKYIDKKDVYEFAEGASVYKLFDENELSSAL